VDTIGKDAFVNIIKLTNDIVIITDNRPVDAGGPRIRYVNNAFSDLTGYTAGEVIGKSPNMLQGEGTSDETKSTIRAALKKEEPVREIILNYGKSGTPYWLDINIIPLRNPQGIVTHFAAIERDVTALKNAEFELRHKATHDGLTNLLNRTAFIEQADAEFARATRHGRPLSLITMDIDHFKQVNDTHGHAAGDSVLRQIGTTITESRRTSDHPGRLGGEEFAILLPETPLEAAEKLANALRKRVAAAITPVTGKNLSVTISVGVTCVAGADNDFESVAARADQAMYQSKSEGRNRVTVLTTEKFRSAA